MFARGGSYIVSWRNQPLWNIRAIKYRYEYAFTCIYSERVHIGFRYIFEIRKQSTKLENLFCIRSPPYIDPPWRAMYKVITRKNKENLYTISDLGVGIASRHSNKESERTATWQRYDANGKFILLLCTHNWYKEKSIIWCESVLLCLRVISLYNDRENSLPLCSMCRIRCVECEWVS